MFSPEVSDKLEYYVYRLIDPRNGDTFYVGKGKGNRVFDHVKGEVANNSDTEDLSDTLKRVREIRNDDFEVAHIIHRHGMDEKTALAVEAALIDAYPEVLNEYAGHGSSDYGCMHAKQVIKQYQRQVKETDIQKHKVLIIKINRSASETDSIHEIYEAVRASWRLGGKAEKAKEAEYVLAVLHGLVIGVFVPTDWLEAINNNFPHKGDRPGRWGFVGEEAPDDIKKFYMRTRIPASMREKGAAAPVRYAY